MNYFETLGLSSAFDIDLSALEAAYFKAQREYHPDRFVSKPALERQNAMQCSIDINQAYETLKNPLKRAQYLLHLQGMRVGTEQDSIKPSQALLMETLEWRERIGEGKNPEEINKILEQMKLKTLKNLSRNYQRAAWDDMAQDALRLGYILKAQEELAQKKRLK